MPNGRVTGDLLSIAVLVLFIAGLSGLYTRKRMTATLCQKFGSEYNRAMLVHGSE
jgi:hypothetical protein